MPGPKKIFRYFFWLFFATREPMISYDPAHETRICMGQQRHIAPNPESARH
jgi:hypothetical protein